jgi:hypothetical protein
VVVAQIIVVANVLMDAHLVELNAQVDANRARRHVAMNADRAVLVAVVHYLMYQMIVLARTIVQPHLVHLTVL